jgi:multidrug efflux system membrane fusion protein
VTDEHRTTPPADAHRLGGKYPRHTRQVATVSVLLLAIGAVFLGWPHRGTGKPDPASIGTAPAVAVAPVVRQDLTVVLQALGTVTPLSTVTVKSQLSGYLTAVSFEEGQLVKKGDLLALVDPRPYQASLTQFQGQLKRDQAMLRNAQLDLARYQRLVAQDSTSRQLADTAAATVTQFEGTVQSDRAQVDMQKLNLTYCHIVAPINGRLGLRQVDAGNFVQPSDPNGLVVITQLQPISSIFTLPQAQLGTVLKRLHAGATLPVTAYDSENESALATGSLRTVDNQIDTSTGTVKLRAIFANNDETLFPNQFVNVRLSVDTLREVLTVPSAAIRHGAPGTYVYLLKPDDTVAVRTIATGAQNDGRTLVMSGLSRGDRVVVDGIDRLNDGMKVSISQVAGGAP